LIEIDRSDMLRKITENPTQEQIEDALRDNENKRVELMQIKELKKRIEELKKSAKGLF
jgi:hypothetical protein